MGTPTIDGGEADPFPKNSAGDHMIGGILISGVLGKGGMGTVYRGIHSRLCVPVAVKILHNEGTHHTQLIQEARLTAKINHPNIVRVYDVNIENNNIYIVQELIDGESAFALTCRFFQKQQFPDESRALEICADVARGLQVIHREGIVHLDIKPENVLICHADGLAKIVDLGLASYFQGERKNEPEVVAGTPGFMSPERYVGAPPSVHDDLYAVGALLFELLTTSPAFPGEAMDKIYWQQVNAVLPDPRKFVPAISDCTAQIVNKCLQPERANRFSNSTMLLEALLDARGRLAGKENKPESTLDPRFKGSRPIAKVLCVDDDEAIGSLVREALTYEGHTVAIVSNGKDALKHLETQQVDLVLTDVIMPHMDGLAFCRMLRAMPEQKGIPVVFMSGRNDVGVIQQAMGMGAVDFLMKPMKVSELCARVRCLARLQQVSREQQQLTRRLNELLATRGINRLEKEPEPQKPKILLADDTESLRNMLQEFLQEEGFEVAAVENGLEAVTVASTNRFDLVILDIDMPIVNGLEACGRLRAIPLSSQTPILFLTTLSDSETINRAFAAGGTDYLTKPANLHLLRARVTNLLSLATMATAAKCNSQMISMIRS